MGWQRGADVHGQVGVTLLWAGPAASLSLSLLSRACGRCGRAEVVPAAWPVADHGPPTADGAQAARHVSAPLVCGAAPAAPPPFAGARRGLLGTGKLGHAVAAAGLASEPAAVASVLQLALVHGRACTCRTPRLWRASLSFPSG